MLFLLKFLALGGLLSCHLEFFLKSFDIILKLLHIALDLLVFEHFKLFLLLVLDVPHELEFLLQLVNSLVFHLYPVLQHVDSSL